MTEPTATDTEIRTLSDVNRIRTHFYGDACEPPHVEMYRCLSCYEESPVSEWGVRGMKCPRCQHVYDDHCVMQAQDRC